MRACALVSYVFLKSNIIHCILVLLMVVVKFCSSKLCNSTSLLVSFESDALFPVVHQNSFGFFLGGRVPLYAHWTVPTAAHISRPWRYFTWYHAHSMARYHTDFALWFSKKIYWNLELHKVLKNVHWRSSSLMKYLDRGWRNGGFSRQW